MSHLIFWLTVLQGLVFLIISDVFTSPRFDPPPAREVVDTRPAPYPPYNHEL